MSRLSTKQRRAARWRDVWVENYRDFRQSEPGRGDAVMASLMADYAEELVRGKPPAGLGFKVPVPGPKETP